MSRRLTRDFRSLNSALRVSRRRITSILKGIDLQHESPGDSSRQYQDKLSTFARRYLSDSEFEAARKRVSRAAIRVYVEEKRAPTGLSTLTLLFATLAPWAFGYAYAHYSSADLQNETARIPVAWIVPLFCGVLFFATSALAYLSPRTSAKISLGRRFMVKYRFRAISIMAVITSFSLWVLIRSRWGNSLTALDAFVRFAVGGAAYLFICIALAMITTLGSNFLSRYKPPLAHPHDWLLLDLVNISAQAQKMRLKWSRPGSAHALLETIERAVRRAESFPYYVGPLFFSDKETRDKVASDGLALAALIRDHQRVIIRASGPNSYDRVIQSMCSGIAALADDDWESFVKHAPPVSGVSRFRSAVQRCFPPLLLLAAAFLIPLIPQVASSPAVSGSVRVTLMVTSALALILPRESSARAPILDALSKAVPISKSEK